METKDVKRNENHQLSAVASSSSSSSSSLIMRKKNTVSEIEKPGQGKGERDKSNDLENERKLEERKETI